MATWREIATDNFAAVMDLVARHWRSAQSRAYYAAYARVAAALASSGVVVPAGREGPSHAKLPALVESHLTQVGILRWQVSVLLRDLYRMRLIADYHPSASVGDGDARQAAALMQRLFRLMERRQT